MRRKVNLVGKNTLTVSIPTKWVRAQRLKKGDSLDVQLQGSELILRRAERTPTRITLALDKERLAKRLIFAAYKSGVDELHLSYKPDPTINEILFGINDAAPGFEVVEQDEKSCTLKTVSEAGEEAYTTTYNRIFSVLRQQAEAVLQTVREGRFETLPGFLIAEKTNNRLTTIARRLLNRGLHPEPSLIAAHYALIELSEKTADAWKFLILSLAKAKRANDAVLHALDELSAQTRDLEKATGGDHAAGARIAKRRKNLTRILIEALEHGEEALVLHNLFDISELTFDLLGPLFTAEMIRQANRVTTVALSACSCRGRRRRRQKRKLYILSKTNLTLVFVMDVAVTRMSSKGQIVIPQEMRQEIAAGEKLLIIKNEEQFILKKVSGLNKSLKDDLEFARRTEEAWKRFDAGEFKSQEGKEFLQELDRW